MMFVSPFLKKVVYPLLSASGYFRHTSACGLAIVTYHGILPQSYNPIDSVLDGNLVTAQAFRRQLRFVTANYNVISPEDVLDWIRGTRSLPERAVLLTCDDGLLNNLTDMLPLLSQEGLRCLFFVTGASADDVRGTLWYEELLVLFLRARSEEFVISGEGVTIRFDLRLPQQRHMAWWSAVRTLSQLNAEKRRRFLLEASAQMEMPEISSASESLNRRFGLLTVAELRELAAAGMAIGAHTVSHPVLPEMDHDLARSEILTSRTRLEEALKTTIWAFAYPFGDPASVNHALLALAQEAGYEAAFVNYGGGLGVPLPKFALPRVHVTAKMQLSELDAHLSGFFQNWRRRAGRDVPILDMDPG